ncbi:MAG: hypothetical protein ACXADB_04575 [Candidatus Hermodarchaeia archaeon]
MIDAEKKECGDIVLNAFLKRGPKLYRHEIDKITGLNELQSRAGIIYLLNKQLLTESGYLDPMDPCSGFELTALGKSKAEG